MRGFTRKPPKSLLHYLSEEHLFWVVIDVSIFSIQKLCTPWKSRSKKVGLKNESQQLNLQIWINRKLSSRDGTTQACFVVFNSPASQVESKFQIGYLFYPPCSSHCYLKISGYSTLLDLNFSKISSAEQKATFWHFWRNWCQPVFW